MRTLGLDLRGVDGERRLGAFDMRVNDAGIKGEREQVDGFQNGEMRGATNDDLATLNEVDASLARIDVDITAAAQDRSGAALHDFDV